MNSITGIIGIVYRDKYPQKEYLLLTNQKTGNITFPAGGKDKKDKSTINTLKREILEETGLKPRDYKIIKTNYIHEFVYNSKKIEREGTKSRQKIYLLKLKNNRIVNPIDKDAKINGFFDYGDVIKKLTFDDQKELFENIIKSKFKVKM